MLGCGRNNPSGLGCMNPSASGYVLLSESAVADGLGEVPLGISVETQTLRASAEEAGTVRETVMSHQPDIHLPAVAGALPGSASAPAAQALESGWSEAYRAWQQTIHGYAQDLRAAATTHEATDADAGRALEGASARLVEDKGNWPGNLRGRESS